MSRRPWVNGTLMAAVVLIAAGLWLRLHRASTVLMWVDEAESSINALTIFDHGVPVDTYLGQPIYENTMTQRWPESAEYEFRDSSYSSKGLAVYHAWLPMYAIAAAQWVGGIEPDQVHDGTRALHGPESVWQRTFWPRVPAVVFSLVLMVTMYLWGREIAGEPGGLAALTLAAVSRSGVWFGSQARYYSATLMMSALTGWALWRAMRRGRWGAFIALGLSEGLLFHTQQLSAVVMALVGLALSPWLLRHRHGWLKCLVAAALAGVVTVPWAVMTGFLEAAQSVPKAYQFMDGVGDYLRYIGDRGDLFTVLLLAVVLVAVRVGNPTWIPLRMKRLCRGHAVVVSVLLVWSLCSYGVFHGMIPAASYFFERLSLIVWVPVMMAVAVVMAVLARSWRPRYAPWLAMLMAVVFLLATGRLVLLRPDSKTVQLSRRMGGVAYLASQTFEPGTRFVAEPNRHLTWTYYTGLPVQSVAALRREYLATYPGPIVYIETQGDYQLPSNKGIREAGRRAGMTLTEQQVQDHAALLWARQWAQDLPRRGLSVDHLPPVPAFLGEVYEKMLEHSARYRRNQLKHLSQLPVFKNMPAERIFDHWLIFFYRFSDPFSRLGKDMHIASRLPQADITLIPSSWIAVFHCPPLNREVVSTDQRQIKIMSDPDREAVP